MTLDNSRKGFRQFYTIRDMNGGMESSGNYPNFIFLSESFLKIKMKAWNWDCEAMIGEETDIGCPICKHGGLKLYSVDSLIIFSSGRKSVRIRNHYKFVCSNPKCQGRFAGLG